MQLMINNTLHDIPAEWQDAPLLSIIRDYLGFTGTKFGCGKGLCGACTVHVDGRATRSCVMPAKAVGKASVTTIEGLSDGDTLHPVQEAWIQESVPQCGYCQAGQIMTAAALLASNPEPSAESIEQTMNGNLCRCGTYPRIRRGVQRAVELASHHVSNSSS